MAYPARVLVDILLRLSWRENDLFYYGISGDSTVTGRPTVLLRIPRKEIIFLWYSLQYTIISPYSSAHE